MREAPTIATLAEALLAGNRRALARAITVVESDATAARQLMPLIYSHTGQANVVGITGAPGAGKSTLVNALAQHWRRQGQTVGIIAVDPSSPFSGGALLGDRIRMQPLGGDVGVFVRSMASRGRLGGLAAASDDAAALIDAAGFANIIIETVGAGQSEIDIWRSAATTLVVATPGTGDDVQSIKAGILEIADIYIVNKADREGADALAHQLRVMLGLADHAAGMWQPPILPTVATRGEGIGAVADAIMRHQNYLVQSAQQQARATARAEHALIASLHELVVAHAKAAEGGERWSGLVAQIVARTTDADTAAHALLNNDNDATTLS